MMRFDLESGEKGFSTAFTNNDSRTAVSSIANDVAERDFTIARDGMISGSDGKYSFPQRDLTIAELWR